LLKGEELGQVRSETQGRRGKQAVVKGVSRKRLDLNFPEDLVALKSRLEDVLIAVLTCVTLRPNRYQPLPLIPAKCQPLPLSLQNVSPSLFIPTNLQPLQLSENSFHGHLFI
jgi:hypothetical protein